MERGERWRDGERKGEREKGATGPVHGGLAWFQGLMHSYPRLMGKRFLSALLHHRASISISRSPSQQQTIINWRKGFKSEASISASFGSESHGSSLPNRPPGERERTEMWFRSTDHLYSASLTPTGLYREGETTDNVSLPPG